MKLIFLKATIKGTIKTLEAQLRAVTGGSEKQFLKGQLFSNELLLEQVTELIDLHQEQKRQRKQDAFIHKTVNGHEKKQ